MAKKCPHNLIHTERLVSNISDHELPQPPLEFVIEKICADCGKWIGCVEVEKDIKKSNTFPRKSS